ncbi:hypothetical protein D3C71_1703610 [compost metagenome]
MAVADNIAEMQIGGNGDSQLLLSAKRFSHGQLMQPEHRTPGVARAPNHQNKQQNRDDSPHLEHIEVRADTGPGQNSVQQIRKRKKNHGEFH